MSHYGYMHSEQHNPAPAIKIDYVYQGIIGRVIIAEYFKDLGERMETCIKWAVKAAYYIGSTYVMFSLAAPGKLLLPLVHIPIDRLKVMEAMAASRYTLIATTAGMIGRGFISWVVLPFARHTHTKYERAADKYINENS
ncbi:hypothetical protein F-M6_0378 [Faustovirus]|nr:hypothetical protein F-M6_0378 [Faustovirus]QJX73132.1 hypothetical protein F-VV57_0371 [Faustovirus]QJX73639.1 hypothetical protein F-VV63_0373 [Faustovirus]